MSKNCYMNDSEFSNVSGGTLGSSTGLSTTKKVIIGVAATVAALGSAYVVGAVYDKKKEGSASDGWGDSFKHPWGLFRKGK